MRLLHVDASILGESSVSRQLSAAIVARLREAHPDIAVTYYDLGTEPIGHLTGAHLAAAQGLFAENPSLQQDVARGRQALEDFLGAHIVVIGAPMYNFSVSSQLKAWIDRLAVAGKTFRYTDKGAQGLAGGKKVIVASSRGGFYGPDTPAAPLDHQETYLRGIFGFFGITDIVFVRAEGVNVSAEQRKAAIVAARAEAAGLAA
ncbi:MAG: FMN-dependent NADH-azoreductase [Gammaproteobacteria bacterium]|nr:FMN-dependent NADH-azoreductase [Gammaproteobacteria bacterium]